MLINTKGLFITGTDTDVGKTVVSAILTLGLNCNYWKPIESGAWPTLSSTWIKNVTGLSEDHFLPERYVLTQPLSPHAAAKIDGISIALDMLTLADSNRFLIVEGAGGVMVPINDSKFMVDIMVQLQLPVLLVARSTLGTINHTLLSLKELRHNGLSVLGVIMNGPLNEGNREAIERYGETIVLGQLETLGNLSADSLQAAYSLYFNKLRKTLMEYMEIYA